MRDHAGAGRMTAQPHLTALIVAAVIAGGALHAVWNAIAKHLDDQVMAFAVIGIPMAVVGGLAVAVTGLPGRTAVYLAVASAVIHVGYEFALLNSYRLGAFNQVYPIARGTSPLVVAVGACFFAGEHLGVVPLAGVALLAFGLMSLALSAGTLTGTELPAISVAALTGLTIASYTVVDGLGVRAAHDPYAYAGLMFALLGPVFPLVALFRRPVAPVTGPDRARPRPARGGAVGARVRHRALGSGPGAARRGRRDQRDQRDLCRRDWDDLPEGALRRPPGRRRGRDRHGHRPDQCLTAADGGGRRGIRATARGAGRPPRAATRLRLT